MAEPLTYQIDHDGRSITCLVCGKTSWHLGDVKQRYCANCKRFHDTAVEPFTVWSLCMVCGLPVGHDDAHPALACGQRCHLACMEEHLQECRWCLASARRKQEGKAEGDEQSSNDPLS